MRARPRRRDRASAGAIEMLAVLVVFTVYVVPTVLLFLNAAAAPTNPYLKPLAELERQTHDVLVVGDNWCCPRDPTSPSHLQNALYRAWAGEPDDFTSTFPHWFTSPEAMLHTFTMTYAPETGHGAHTATLYTDRNATGPAAGAMSFPSIQPRAPAYVVPRLDNITGKTSTDTHYLPLHQEWNYRHGPIGEHSTEITTTIEYTRTAFTSPDDLELRQARHTETAGGWSPGINAHWEEPDWEGMLTNPLDPAAQEPRFTLALTKEQLAAERALYQQQCLLDALTPNGSAPDCDDVDNGAYAQHGFQLHVTIHGPGQIAHATTKLVNGSANNVYEHAYLVQIRVPRDWTDVEIVDDDAQDNHERGYHNATITQLPTDDTLITAHLRLENTTYSNNVPLDDHRTTRYILRPLQKEQAPFHFHARPPTITDNNDVGFQSIHASVHNLAWDYRQDTNLALELAANPGRVHRTIAALAPQIIPRTQPATNPIGVQLPLGATLLNGAEETTITRIWWQLPATALIDTTGSPTPLYDFTALVEPNAEPFASAWRISPEGDPTRDAALPQTGDLLIWKPLLTSPPGTCPPLTACGVAANVTLNGRAFQESALRPPSTATILYETRDLDAFTDYFIRNDWGHNGHPNDNHDPGFAMAHLSPPAAPGEVTGSQLWTLNPSSTPLCTTTQLRLRDQANATGGPPYKRDFGPREDGYPRTSTDPLECPPPDGKTQLFNARFPLIGRTGTNEHGTWGLRAVGHTTYGTLNGIPIDAVNAWRTGLSEAYIDGPHTAPAGTNTTLYIHLESLLDHLISEGVSEATVRVKVTDPYNAWERLSWLDQVTHRDATLVPAPSDPGGYDCNLPQHNHGFPGAPPPSNPCNDELPPFIRVTLPIGVNTVPGTHLVTVEISWVHENPDGTQVTQTGRLVHPLDVVTPSGVHARPTSMGALTWMEDWG